MLANDAILAVAYDFPAPGDSEWRCDTKSWAEKQRKQVGLTFVHWLLADVALVTELVTTCKHAAIRPAPIQARLPANTGLL